jgi:hypothetical protein
MKKRAVKVIISLFVLVIFSPVMMANAAGYWQFLKTKIMQPSGQPGFSYVDSGPQGVVMKLHPDKDTALDIKCTFQPPPRQLATNLDRPIYMTYNNIRIANPKKLAVALGMSSMWDAPGLGPGAITGGAIRIGTGYSNMIQGAVVSIPGKFIPPAGSGTRSLYQSCGYGTTASTYTVEYQYTWVAK